MKILYIVNVGNRINNFSYSSMMAALQMGAEFHIAGNWSGYMSDEEKKRDEEKFGIKIHQIDFIRRPYDLRNINAYRQVCKLIEQEEYDLIHCNTPIGGVVGRLAGRRCHVKKIIYQAHGFHFYQGAPLFNWLIYYPIEKLLARFTDCLITINEEDYNLAKNKLKLRKGGRVYYVPGVGIDTAAYKPDIGKCDECVPLRIRKRAELGIEMDKLLIISVGELNANKNNHVIIEAIAKMHDSDIHYALCGIGTEQEHLEQLAEKLGISNQIHFLGFRKDVAELYKVADIFTLPSYREGLSRSLMEAMASGLPCIASDIRGNRDLIENAKGGFLVPVGDVNKIAEKMELLAENAALRKKMAESNLERILNFDTEKVKDEIRKIYNTILEGEK